MSNHFLEPVVVSRMLYLVVSITFTSCKRMITGIIARTLNESFFFPSQVHFGGIILEPLDKLGLAHLCYMVRLPNNSVLIYLTFKVQEFWKC